MPRKRADNIRLRIGENHSHANSSQSQPFVNDAMRGIAQAAAEVTAPPDLMITIP
jgi:hypothetical protein